jgi:hypothetical protein
MGLSFNENVQTICLILNILVIFLSFILFVNNYDSSVLKYEKFIFIFTFIWGISMLIFNSIKNNNLEIDKKISIDMRETTKTNEIINELINHNELYFHLTLLAFYIMFIVLGFYLYKTK